MLVKNKLNKKAFTVAELLVATAIFMLFIGAVFSLYRMGSRMYVSGSWKYMRQKEAERFFIAMKERVEQSSNYIKIKPNTDKDKKANNKNTDEINTVATKFVSLTNGKNITASREKAGNTKQWIAEFVVTKPDMSALPPYTKKGTVVFHSILLTPNAESGLYDLQMRAARDANNAEFFKGVGNDFPIGYASLSQAKFDADPALYGLSPVPHTFEIHDIASLTVNWSYAASSSFDIGNVEKSPVFGLSIMMQNPKHAQTVLEMGCKARIDSSVQYVERQSL